MTALAEREVRGEPELVVVDDLEAVAERAAERVAHGLATAVESRGRADWATTGGSVAPALYRRLADSPTRNEVPWRDVHVWWGDDRFVPRDHPLSNVKPFNDILLAGVPRPVHMPIDHRHPFPTSEAIGASQDAAWCAARLGDELRTAGLGRSGAWPVFDVVVVGVGADGHVLSVFPGAEAFSSDDQALAVPAPTHIEPHVERVTLNPAVVAVARTVVVVASGASKASVIRDALRGDRDPRRLPVQLARHANAVWILDAAAASDLVGDA